MNRRGRKKKSYSKLIIRREREEVNLLGRLPLINYSNTNHPPEFLLIALFFVYLPENELGLNTSAIGTVNGYR